MPYVRRNRRKTFKRGRYLRKKVPGVRRRVRKITRISRFSSPIRYFKRTMVITSSTLGIVTAGSWAAGTGMSYMQVTGGTANGVIAYGSFSYTGFLEDLPGYTDFTNLFDMYKITGIKVRFIPYSSSGATAGTQLSSGSAPVIHTVLDFDDNAVPLATETGLQTMRQSSYYRVSRNKMSRYFSPKQTGYVQDSIALADATTSLKPRWVSTEAARVYHMGLKGIVECISNGDPLTRYWFYKPEVTMYLAFKDVE